mgnify:CR=1 FL=1
MTLLSAVAMVIAFAAVLGCGVLGPPLLIEEWLEALAPLGTLGGLIAIVAAWCAGCGRAARRGGPSSELAEAAAFASCGTGLQWIAAAVLWAWLPSLVPDSWFEPGTGTSFCNVLIAFMLFSLGVWRAIFFVCLWPSPALPNRAPDDLAPSRQSRVP